MKIRTLIILLLLMSMHAFGQRIGIQLAVKEAQTFLGSRQQAKGMARPDMTLRHVPLRDAIGRDGDELYIFNIGRKDGFIVVSGDERTRQVLAYADRGAIRTEGMPEALLFMLRQYADDISALPHSADLQTAPLHSAVSPMIDVCWSQTAPYNSQCPKISGMQSVTGCVATAMAQTLYYVRPTSCKTLKGYNTKSSNTWVPALSATTFDYDILRTTYAETDNDDSAKEVARLMRYCGQSTEMDYSTASGTPAEMVVYALRNSFDLGSTCHQVFRQNYRCAEWNNLIYNELASNRPVIVCGENATEGHAFVCDGYDGDGLFHINWGWNGGYNGYFLIDRLSPYNSGMGSTCDGYASGMSAIIGIQRKAEGEPTLYTLKCVSMGTYQNNVSRSSSASDFSLWANITLTNLNRDQSNMELTWALCDTNGSILQQAGQATTLSINYGKQSQLKLSGQLGSGITDGTYRVVPLCRIKGASQWTLCENEFAGAMLMTVSGNTARLERFAGTTSREQYALSDITITGSGIATYQHLLSMRATNNGTSNSGTLYVLIDGVMKKSVAMNIDPGSTQQMDVALTFASGTHAIDIATRQFNSSTGLYDYTTIATTSYAVLSESYCRLQEMLLTVLSDNTLTDNAFVLYDNHADLRCNIVNSTSTAYRGQVSFLITADGQESRQRIVVNIPPQSADEVLLSIDNLAEGVIYTIQPQCKVGVSWTAVGSPVSIIYANTTAVRPILSAPHSTIYTLDGRRLPAPPQGLYIQNGRKHVR